MYPNYPSFSANYLLPRVTPEVPAGTWVGVHVWHMPTATYLTVSSSSQWAPTGLTWYPHCP